MSIKILTRNMDVPHLTRIDVYESLGGYQGLRKAAAARVSRQA